MTLLGMIVLACLMGGLFSLMVSSWLAFKLAPFALGPMVAFAAGTMLAAALLDVLPEAFILSEGQHRTMFATLLAGLLGFHWLERASLEPQDRTSAPGLAQTRPNRGAVWIVLLGDSVHNFADGLMIAAAFLADPWLGLTTTVAVVMHEIPQELGDFVLLRAAGWNQRKAIIANGLSSLASVLGGVLGWLALETYRSALPYALTLAAASFLYVSVADLMPLLHRRHRQDNFIAQSVLLAAGVGSVPMLAHWLNP